MNTYLKSLLFVVALFASASLFPKQVTAQQDYVSLQVFYDELSPYGEWIDYPQYGYVWIPDEGSDFMPYSTEGQWILTDYGWTWASDYEWGWAPFHYGRWDYDNYYGWIWFPDYEWGPSWVTWRSASGYYGWQPMRPGISINFSFGNDYYNDYSDYWMFVRDRDFQRPNVSRYYINSSNRDRIIRNSVVINNTYIDNSRNTTYVSGPSRENVQRNTGRRVNSVSIRESNTPGQALKNGQLQMYRPKVRKNSDLQQKPAPVRISNKEDMKRLSERNAVNPKRNASPSKNNRQQQQRQNNFDRQNRENTQPVQQQRVNPAENNRQRQQQERENKVNRQNLERNNDQPVQQQRANQAENNRQRQQKERENNINRQNLEKNNDQPVQQQRVNPAENNRQRQQQVRENNINQQNLEKNKSQQIQQQKINKQENKRQEQQPAQVAPNTNRNLEQPAQQRNVKSPNTSSREQKQVIRQEKSTRNKQQKESKEKEDKNRKN